MLMEESTTYQYILSRGRDEGLILGRRRTLLSLATQWFGEPTPEQLQQFNALTDPSKMDRLELEIRNILNWDELVKYL